MGIISQLSLSPPELVSPEHDVANFECGEPSLDAWLKERAVKNQLSGASRCFVLCDESKAKKVIGYYCLSAGAICHETLSKAMRRNMPNPLPVLVLGRLAVDKNYHNQGLGSALLRDAVIRALSVARDAGVVAILVHALSEQAKRFYLSCGFVESPLQPMTLMLTLETARAIFLER